MGGKPRVKVPLSEELVERARAALYALPSIDNGRLSERKMFGGVCFLYEDKMACGVVGRDLMVRIAPDAFESALEEPHVRVMDFTGRPMRGFLYLNETGWSQNKVLRAWLTRCTGYAKSLPPKRPKKSKRNT